MGLRSDCLGEQVFELLRILEPVAMGLQIEGSSEHVGISGGNGLLSRYHWLFEALNCPLILLAFVLLLLAFALTLLAFLTSQLLILNLICSTKVTRSSTDNTQLTFYQSGSNCPPTTFFSTQLKR